MLKPSSYKNIRITRPRGDRAPDFPNKRRKHMPLTLSNVKGWSGGALVSNPHIKTYTPLCLRYFCTPSRARLLSISDAGHPGDICMNSHHSGSLGFQNSSINAEATHQWEGLQHVHAQAGGQRKLDPHISTSPIHVCNYRISRFFEGLATPA